ncbi:hypothetical protein SS1G_08172 [Sclerotinia sclerotiorum 1980 UF-70]|uniref:COP9 signalosome complex subunit 3 N-terminal helical repeats domain-containing protein n=1 Tax=Sclerotinia sclerotiorum (strain ATCC 18683 / 1980 / Ss-1) TaxID=665079 RepID=A7ES67_SCLS1|nr:hypothetical protein SS1G_08172 [Sclerotinia sclerotiorum 1980 UF-70]EDN92309.1 hypothetical protein SS1G_08172 [Sclerotinia sclerotiorum 1980 UF-70]
MDNFLSRMLLFPPHPAPLVPLSDSQYDAGITSQIETLKKTSEKTLLQSTAGGESPLDVINPSLNTVPYIYILNAHIAAAYKNEKGINIDNLWDKATSFLHSFDPRQIRYLGEELQDIMSFVAEVASQQHQSYVTIKSSLTTKLKPLDVLEYFYYSGSIYIGLHKWDAALEMLENAITYPVNEGGVSLVMVEAYKKWLLVGILQYGRVLQLPKTTSAPAAKAYHIIAKPYEAVASIFETGSAARLKSEAEFGRQLWTDDGNFGLMYCVLCAYQKFQIRNLTNVYSKIGAADIMSLTTSAETGVKLTSIKQIEDLIQSMIADGTLPATMIRDQSGHAVLAFSPTGPVLSETQVQIDLVASTRRIQSLAKQIKVTDRVLTHDKRYLDSAQRAKSKAKKVGGVTMDPMDWNTVIEDEDIMTEMY